MSRSDQEILDDRDSVEMMRRPNIWPQWPILPLNKGRLPALQEGLYLDAEGYENTVVLCNLFLFDGGKMESYEKVKYDSIEAVVADGWEVD